jgi:hypothetical protein
VTKILLGVVLAAGLHAGSAAAATVPCSGLPGSLSDPAGDAFFFGGPTPSPDIVCAGAQVSGGNLLLRVGFAPGTFDPATTRVSFNLDIDQNPATGFSGITNGNADSAVMGVEYLVEFGSNYNIGLAWVETVPGLSVLGTGPVEFFDDGMVATVLLSLLGDDGLFNFKTTVQTQNPPTQQFPVSFTIIQDFASDLGLAPGTTAIAEPATLSLYGIALLALARGRRKEKAAAI